MSKIISRIFSVILVLAILYSGFRVEKILNNYRIEKEKKIEVTQKVRTGRDVDFKELLKKNSDVKGWIYVKDTEIDYPIVQAEDNDFYLHRNLDKEYLYDGSIFIDCDVENPFKDFNTLIYGHHMFSGAMFCHLDKFKDKDFFDKHKIIVIETPEKSYDMHVIAYCNESAEDGFYTTYFPDTMETPLLYEEETEEFWYTKEDFINDIKSSAINISDEPFDENDTYVTLSTCAYNYDNARTQVIGVLRDAEMVDSAEVIETDKKSINIWLFAQIGVGIIMLLSLALLIPKKKK